MHFVANACARVAFYVPWQKTVTFEAESDRLTMIISTTCALSLASAVTVQDIVIGLQEPPKNKLTKNRGPSHAQARFV